MTDYFALFELPRRPALDPEQLKEAYFRLAARLHPDASTGDAAEFAVLQEALKTLQHPPSRLRHLRELQFPADLTRTAMPLQGDLFLQVGSTLARVKRFMEKQAAAQSALSKALLTDEKNSTVELLRQTKEAVQKAVAGAQEGLARLDERWPGISVDEIGSLASEWSYLAKWQAELAEWEFRLTQA